MKAEIFMKIALEKYSEILQKLNEEHKGFYGAPHGARTVGFNKDAEYCGLEILKNGFRWTRFSGNQITFLNDGRIKVNGRRHGVDEFLGQFFSKDELTSAKILNIESQEPHRPVGDTL